jgi:hypothetical protein
LIQGLALYQIGAYIYGVKLEVPMEHTSLETQSIESAVGRLERQAAGLLVELEKINKKLETLREAQSIIAGGDGALQPSEPLPAQAATRPPAIVKIREILDEFVARGGKFQRAAVMRALTNAGYSRTGDHLHTRLASRLKTLRREGVIVAAGKRGTYKVIVAKDNEHTVK